MLPGLRNPLEPLKLTIIRFGGTISVSPIPQNSALILPRISFVFPGSKFKQNKKNWRRCRMKLIRQRSKFTGVFLVILMVLVAVPYQSVLAAMIETETTLDITLKGQEARNTIKTILAREDAQAVLRAQGIDPLEAMARVDTLTDAEAQRIADEIEELPAGGNFFLTFLLVVGIIVVILIITDAMGYTNVFTFVR